MAKGKGPISIKDIAAKGQQKERKPSLPSPNMNARGAYEYVTKYSETTQTNTTEELRKNHGNTTEKTSTKPTEELRKNHGNTTDGKHEYYGNTTANTTDEKHEYYGNTTEILRKSGIPTKDFKLLAGLQEKVFRYVFERSKMYGSNTPNGDRLCPKIGAAEIARTVTRSDEKKVRDIIRELKQGNLLIRHTYKPGPGGWTQFLIPSSIYSQALLSEIHGNSTEELRKNHGNTTDKTTDKTTDAVPSSSSYIINTTTTREADNGWDLISIPQSLEGIGFGNSQVQQLSKLGTLSPLDVQDSLEAFAYDLETGKVRSQGSKLGFIMGILRKSGKYTSDAYLAEMKSFIDANHKRMLEMDSIKKQQSEDALTEKAKAQLQVLSEEDKRKLAPENSIAKVGSVNHDRLVIAVLVKRLLDSRTPQ